MATIQLNFSLRTSSKCQSVHLIGSWNGYDGQLPLSMDPSKGPGGWKGTFRFNSSMLEQGKRYWYYYVVDGYHCSHDPARDSVFEPHSGRTLNYIDIPYAKGSSGGSSGGYSGSSRSSARYSSRRPGDLDVVTGRSLSPSQIRSPVPSKPYATRQIATERFDPSDMDQLAQRYSRQTISSSGSRTSFESDDSDYSYRYGRSSSNGSSGSTSPSSMSSGSSCHCNRYAITRSGARVKLDCKGARCGYSDSSSSGCSSESEGEDARYSSRGGGATSSSRRQGIVGGRY